MKTAILFLAYLIIANCNPAAKGKWHWDSSLPKLTPISRGAHIEPLLVLKAHPRTKAETPRLEKADLGSELSAPSLDTRIVGGTEAVPHEFPWMVALIINGLYFCGGILISDTWVLTTGHCTNIANSIEVIMGAHNREIFETTQVRMTSTYIITHVNYDSVDLHNDIGLVRLPTPVTYTNAIRNISLPKLSDADLGGGIPLTASGWGYTKNGGPSLTTNLQKVTNPSMFNADCDNTYGAIITANNICTSTSNGNKGICDGDAGGPLMHLVDGSIPLYVCRGISSFTSSAGCTSGLPNGFTRVTHYLDWISTNTGIIIDP